MKSRNVKTLLSKAKVGNFSTSHLNLDGLFAFTCEVERFTQGA